MLLVIKMGGSILKEGASTDLVADLKDFWQKTKSFSSTAAASRSPKSPRSWAKNKNSSCQPEGFRSRYTDKETIEIYSMVMAGKINKQIVLPLQSQGIPAVGLSGLDAAILQAERKKRIIEVDANGTEARHRRWLHRQNKHRKHRPLPAVAEQRLRTHRDAHSHERRV